MRNLIALAVMALLCFTGCKKSENSGVAARPDDAVSLKLKQLAGSGATDCGRLDVKATDQQSKTAISCATQAAQNKHPFYVAYDMPGMSTGVAGSSEGKLFAVELQGSGPGAQLQSGPCPAEMRVAHSGRVNDGIESQRRGSAQRDQCESGCHAGRRDASPVSHSGRRREKSSAKEAVVPGRWVLVLRGERHGRLATLP
jgi:hypothetical protein